jgi:hypothetical protein
LLILSRSERQLSGFEVRPDLHNFMPRRPREFSHLTFPLWSFSAAFSSTFAAKQFLKFFHLNLRVANQPAKQTGFDRPMIRNGEWLLCRVARMAQADMASTLAHYFITKALERPDNLLP